MFKIKKTGLVGSLQLLALIATGTLAAAGTLSWPVAKVLVTATFGETRSDHFHSGIDLGGDNQEVRPIADGTLVYYFDEAEHPLYRGFGNGNLAILQHADKSRSYYYHMRKASVSTRRTNVTTGDVIGLSGNTGRSFGAHLHLGFSEKPGGYVNPLDKLPAIRDGIKPEVASIMFLCEGRVLTIPEKYRVTGIDSFRLLAKIWDSNEDSRKLNTVGVRKAVFFIDDQPVKTIDFGKLLEKNGRLTLADGTAFEDAYSPSGYLIGGDYRNLVGQHKIKVQAEDFNGNTASRTVEVHFR